ncbi:HAD family hydrolase [Hugenholtzia roseola]|uniref:HAD family hydrolase n=1 Tax=Hugenholtzia roseola TaxID=1002 RepID=UPI0004284E05|nr:HAD family hydrolase [Hugenholtzia roseola]
MKYKNEDKTLLILDLDETLIHASREEIGITADFLLGDYQVYKRPYLEIFLATIQPHFEVAVWSSASDDYVEQMVERVFPANFPLSFVWGRSRCTTKYRFYHDAYFKNNKENDYYYQIKNLKKVKKQGYNLDRVLIVDDTPEKVKQNFGNAIYPTPYVGNFDDNELNLLQFYLLFLKDKICVRNIEKRNWQLFTKNFLINNQ